MSIPDWPDVPIVTPLWRRFRQVQPQLRTFLWAICLLAICSAIFHTILNNFLNDAYHIDATQRGHLEFPREFPGFLVAVFAAGLFFLPVQRMAALAALLNALGILGLGLVGGHSYSLVIASLMVWSAGGHLQQPTGASITLALSREGRQGTRLGQVGAIGTLVGILGMLAVWVGMGRLNIGYRPMFVLACMVGLIGAWTFLRIGPLREVPPKRPPMVLKRRYALYYALSVLFGARKQIFLTFGPWVLIKLFGQPPETFAKLGIVGNLIGIGFQPLLGKLIDRVGERAILVAEGLALVLVCLAYGYPEMLVRGQGAVWVVYASYVLDQVLFAVGMARTTYLDKIAERKEDVTASLALGVSLDHAVSMSIPSLGGWVWDNYRPPRVFLGAAAMSLVYSALASLLRVPREAKALVPPPPRIGEPD
jgi:hypothetical protein